jgi:hypothetical protein
MKRRLTALAVAAAIVGAAPAVAPVDRAPSLAPPAAHAKSCSPGYVHARLSWGHKCLRRGQFCKRSADREYHRYGFHCHRRDRRGNYHLS